MQNGLADFTFFGGIVGFASTDDNISDANANYVYIGGTTEGKYSSLPPLPSSLSCISHKPCSHAWARAGRPKRIQRRLRHPTRHRVRALDTRS